MIAVKIGDDCSRKVVEYRKLNKKDMWSETMLNMVQETKHNEWSEIVFNQNN